MKVSSKNDQKIRMIEMKTYATKKKKIMELKLNFLVQLSDKLDNFFFV